MRTTIRLPDDLLRQMKARAAEGGRTLNAVIEEAARLWLAPRPEPRPRVPVPVSKQRGGLEPGVSLESTSALIEWLERDLPLEKRR